MCLKLCEPFEEILCYFLNGFCLCFFWVFYWLVIILKVLLFDILGGTFVLLLERLFRIIQNLFLIIVFGTSKKIWEISTDMKKFQNFLTDLILFYFFYKILIFFNLLNFSISFESLEKLIILVIISCIIYISKQNYFGK